MQLERTDEALEAVVGPTPPGSSVRRTAPGPGGLRSAPGGPSTTVALWEVDPCDWAMPGATPSPGASRQARPGSIVLMHDGGGDRAQTAEALPAIIEGLLDRGHRFVRSTR